MLKAGLRGVPAPLAALTTNDERTIAMAGTPVSRRGNRFKDLMGQTFGRLTVQSEAGRQKNRQVLWLCKCECGGEIIAQGSHLRTGHTKSCRCLSREIVTTRNVETAVHGMTGSPEHNAWLAMLSRCYSKNAGNYAKYGGRGVTVCDRWRFGEDGKTGFQCFYEDMGPKPRLDLSLDRFPRSTGNYEPGNCRWATIFEQNRNRRNVIEAQRRRQRDLLSDRRVA